jgi:hypothetical protein
LSRDQPHHPAFAHSTILVSVHKVHIDEKWFFLTQDGEKYILVQGEEPPKRHVRADDTYLADAIEELGLTNKVKFYTQPPNSPDLNILDLGLFASLQAAYYVNSPSNQVELIAMVEQNYAEYDYKKINRLWITLQSIFNCIIENHGENFYKIPHMNKAKMERENRLPIALEVSGQAMLECGMYNLSG